MKRNDSPYSVLFSLIILLLLSFGQAATLTVTTTDDSLDGIDLTNSCSLREAVESANQNQDIGGCSSSGSYGDDTIILPAGTYELVSSFSLITDPVVVIGTNGLNILDDLTITGDSAQTTMIDGGSLTCCDNEIIAVIGTSLTLSNLSLQRSPTYAIDNINGSLDLDTVSIHSNAGGVRSNSHLTVKNSSFISNATSANGGAIRAEGASSPIKTVRIENTTFTGNSAGASGGAIYATGSNLKLILSSSTVTTNIADSDANNSGNGGGIASTLSTPARIENSIIAKNTDDSTTTSRKRADCSGSFDSRNHNLIGDTSGCSGFTESHDLTGTASNPLDPRLGEFNYHGGETRSRLLEPDSPAIDAGPFGFEDACLAVDQRGVARAEDGDGNGFLNCDIGAVEMHDPSLSISLGRRSPRTLSLSSTGKTVMMQLELSSKRNLLFKRLAVSASGTVTDDRNIKIIHDRDSDGRVDAGEPVLGSGHFSKTDNHEVIMLDQFLDIEAGSSEHILIVLDTGRNTFLGFIPLGLLGLGFMVRRKKLSLLSCMLALILVTSACSQQSDIELNTAANKTFQVTATAAKATVKSSFGSSITSAPIKGLTIDSPVLSIPILFR